MIIKKIDNKEREKNMDLKKSIKESIKIFFKVFLLIMVIITFYFTTAFLFSFFPTKGSETPKTATIYILYNTMHSDIALKLDSTNEAWDEVLATVIKNKRGYIAFGWGDKETYINTPTWDELSISTTLKALFINTPSLIHVSHLSNINSYQNIKKINISKKQLIALEKHILKSFNFKKNQHYKAYKNNDLFYPSHHQYNLFNTCNTWTGDRLRDANISVSYWTPLSQNVVDSLP